MLKQQIFGFGVYIRSLPWTSHPCPANLDATMHALNVAVTRRADNPTTGFLDQSKWQSGAAFPFIKCGLNVVAHLLGGAHCSGNPLPKILVESHFRETRRMLKCEWFQSYVLPF